jgi:Hemerythrin HHE cation binding domain
MSFEDLHRLHGEHRYARQCLDLLHTAVSCPSCPPAGHAFLGLLQEAAAYFEHDMPRHMLDEEMNVFPRYLALEGSRDLWSLREEHQDLWVLAAEFACWVRRFVDDPTDERWRMVRQHAIELEIVARRHMVHEDEVLRRLAKAERACEPGSRLA